MILRSRCSSLSSIWRGRPSKTECLIASQPPLPRLRSITTSQATLSEVLPLPRALKPSKGMLLLETPVAPKFWPSHLDLYSPLLSRASKVLKPHSITVNMVYDGTSTQETFPGGIAGAEEAYSARLLFPDGHSTSYPSFTQAMLDEKSNGKSKFLSEVSEYTTGVKGLMANGVKSGSWEIVVCTHGSRDCRCSDHGGPLVDALKEQLTLRGSGAKIKVKEIAHVGGHKYAANAILLPSLDMLSNLRPSDAPALVDHILSNRPPSSPMWSRWRGRYGLSEAQQARVWASTTAGKTELALSTTTSGNSEAAAAVEQVGLVFRTWEGERKAVQGRIGENLLELARREGLPAMEGVCGGNLECATCHLYLPSSAPAPEPSDEELDMLGYALGYKDGESRLGCQIRVDKNLGEWCRAGGVISLPRF